MHSPWIANCLYPLVPEGSSTRRFGSLELALVHRPQGICSAAQGQKSLNSIKSSQQEAPQEAGEQLRQRTKGLAVLEKTNLGSHPTDSVPPPTPSLSINPAQGRGERSQSLLDTRRGNYSTPCF